MRVKLWTLQYAPIVLITILAASIRLYNLAYLMPFIGDQAWFFLSARDSLAEGTIPLVGITASRTWLHQGPFWTYILMILFSFGGFDPIIAGYLTALTSVLAVVAIYHVLQSMHDKQAALIGAFLYATSPLVILSDRMPYHTTFTPLIMIGVYWTLWMIMQGRSRLWPFLVGLIAIMQNTNIAGFPSVYVIAGFVGYGYVTGKSWMKNFTKKTILYSILTWLLLMMPSIIYDLMSGHGYPQTVYLYIWMVAQPVVAVFRSDHSSLMPILQFLVLSIQRLIFLPSAHVSIFILAGALLYSLRHIFQKKNRKMTPLVYSLIWTLSMLLIVTVGKTPSQAYVYTLYPLIIILYAQVCGLMLSHETKRAWLLYLLIFALGSINCISLVRSNYLMGTTGGYGATLIERKKLAETIVAQAENKPYSLKVVGPGEQFTSTGMYMEYLTWLLGHAPTAGAEKTFEIYEKDGELQMRSFELLQ